MSTHQLSSFCLNFDSRGRMHELYFFFFSVDFLSQLACSSHARELLVHRSTSKYQRQWLCSFRISDFSFTMFLGFQNDFSYSDWITFKKWSFLQFLTEKNKTFLYQRHLWYKQERTKNIGCCVDTTGCRRTPNDYGNKTQVQQTFPSPNRERLVLYEHILGAKTCLIYNQYLC